MRSLPTALLEIYLYYIPKIAENKPLWIRGAEMLSLRTLMSHVIMRRRADTYAESTLSAKGAVGGHLFSGVIV